jgi:hypothetical protein
MLHKRELPSNIKRDLKRAHIKQLRFIKWLLTSPPAVLDQVALSVSLGDELGKWLWDRILWQGEITVYGKAVFALLAKINTDSMGANEVWTAIHHDVRFSFNWNNPNFLFRFPRLPEDWRIVVAKVLSKFYDWLVDLGFSKLTFSLTAEKLDRLSILRAYRNSYARVCGYCDGSAGDMTDDKAADHIDHFFPKSEYPHLSIHPDNLFAACSGCNSIWKLALNPVPDVRAGMLEDTYHPWLVPGRDVIRIAVQADPANWSNLSLELTDPVRPKCALNLNRMLNLDERWSGRVNSDLKRQRSKYVATRIRELPLGFDENSIKACIEAEKRACKERIDSEADQLLRIAVLDFLVGTADEIQAIIDCHR